MIRLFLKKRKKEKMPLFTVRSRANCWRAGGLWRSPLRSKLAFLHIPVGRIAPMMPHGTFFSNPTRAAANDRGGPFAFKPVLSF
jgi:hypothetical protein